MGSEKYPEEDAYSEHISANGGFANAFTQFEATNYQFEVKYSGLRKALDMQASNFGSPLFKQSAVDREIKSIESEFQMYMTDDTVRMIQILQEQTVRKDHLFNCFMWGNIESLSG